MRLALKLLAHPLDLARLCHGVRRSGRSHPDYAAMRAAVARELAPFAGRRADVDRQWGELERWDDEHAARLVVRGGRGRARARRVDHERVRWMAWAIERLARWFALPDLDLLLYFGDHIDRDPEHAPVLCFCRRRQRVGQVLIPDFEILRGHERLDRGRFDEPGCEAIPRARLVAASRAHPELIDARFTRFRAGRGVQRGAARWRLALRRGLAGCKRALAL